MCGISGFWGPRDRKLLEAMTDAQRHRGPDDEGYFEADEASLGFRRLSIIDIEHGQQPMATDDGLVHIVYNGEVYNFRELRAELEPLGHTFRTNCDTEVVLHAYEEWGTDCFARFNGMWGLALLDRRYGAPRLVLARDHFGIKPLFFARNGRRVLFASEVKSILQDPSFERAVNERAMFDYLAYGLFDHTTSTFFEGVRQVPAAAFAVIDDSGITETTYWTPRLSESGSADPEDFRAVFERAVERRLVADVPLGICLSGGLDSSSICGVMSKLLSERVPDATSMGDRLKTFSAVFPGDPIDEADYIAEVVKRTGAENAQVQPTASDFIRELEAWVWHVEEPMVSSAPFAMWMVMRRARQDVTVVLDGQAGDELLGGYSHYPYVFLRELAHKRRWRKFVREAWRTRDVVVPLIRRRLRDRRQRVDVAGLLQPTFLRRHAPPRDDRVTNNLKLRLLQDFVTYSLPPLLRYEDRISMAHSLEARLPFLDQELVEHILSLPTAAIIDDGWNRAVLRKALRPVLPDKIHRRRKKIGFTTPEFRWFRRQRAALQSLMRSPSFSGRPWWNGPAVAEAFRQACVGEREENMFFWRAINAEVWMRIFIDDQATSLNDHSYASGFAVRGDAHVRAALDPADAQGLAASGPNPRRHLFMTSNGGTYARIPLRSPVIDRGDDVADVLAGCLDHLRQQGCEPRDGDLVVISEKALAISQGRGRPVDEIHCTIAARVLSRFVTRSPIGIGLGHPTTMQLAIDEVGLGRILLATAAAGVTRPFGRHGVFYRVAGSRVNAIDGPSHANLPPFDRWAMAAPLDSEGEARRIAAAISDRFGARIDVAIIDANDLTSEVFAITNGFSIPTLRGLVSDNPLGQSAEQTPFGLIRQITEQLPAAATA